jgi:hypothetical protein
MSKLKKENLIQNLVDDILESDQVTQKSSGEQGPNDTEINFGAADDYIEIDLDEDELDQKETGIAKIHIEKNVSNNSQSSKPKNIENSESNFTRLDQSQATDMMSAIAVTKRIIDDKSTVLQDDMSTQIPKKQGQQNPVKKDSNLRAPEPKIEVNKDLSDKTEKVEIQPFSTVSSVSSEPVESRSFAFESKINDSKLAIAENLKLAQSKIEDLERLNEKLSVENEELASAAETFRNRVDDLLIKIDHVQKKYTDLGENVGDEKEILLSSLAAKEKELQDFKQKNEQLELRLQQGIRKIKVRERELENRLELVKLEGQALLKSKDEMILNLKREMDKLNVEVDNLRHKLLDGNKGLNQKQEVIRKTVKTLRLALSLLEVEDLTPREKPVTKPLKKVD